MTARLRELILEGQRALSAESPVVSEEGWMNAADPRDDRWRRGHPKAVPVTAEVSREGERVKKDDKPGWTDAGLWDLVDR